MKKISLTQGKFAQIDDLDYEIVKNYKWHASKCGKVSYAAHKFYSLEGSKTVYMHRMLFPLIKEGQIDHIDGNGLNNQRENLRVCTISQNKQNVGLTKSNTSGFKGVSYHKMGKKWQVKIRIGKENRYLGLFNTKEEAGEVYRKASLEHHKEFSNFSR